MSTLEESTNSTTLSAAPTAESQRREMSGGTHFEALDGYRALAAVMVVLTHVAFATGVVVAGVWGHVLARFDAGVALFFLLSGFLLYRPWARAALGRGPRPSLRRYVVRRAARIMPLYLVVVVVTLALLPEIQPVSLRSWLVHLTATQIYTPAGAIEGLTQTWSLCTEVAFYALLPILGAWAVSGSGRDPWRRQWVMLGALVAVSLAFTVIRMTTDALPDQAGYWLPGYLDWFSLGMGLSLIELRSRDDDPPPVVRVLVTLGRDQWSCLALALGLFAMTVTPLGGAYDFSPTGGWETVVKHTLYGVAAAVLLLPGVLRAQGPIANTFARRPVVLVGIISYGVFLWHLMLLRLVMPALGLPYFTGGFFQVAVALLVATVLVSTITYRLVERPTQRWAHRR